MFHQCGLFSSIIKIPDYCSELAERPKLIQELFERSFMLCTTLNKQEPLDGHFTDTFQNFFSLSEIRFYLHLALIMEPFAQCKIDINPKSNKTEPLVFHLIKAGLKVNLQFPFPYRGLIRIICSSLEMIQK